MQAVSISTAELAALSPDRSRHYCAELEQGNILLFPETPIAIAPEDILFLLQQKQVGGDYHKNIAYRPVADKLTGYAAPRSADRDRMHRVMRAYSRGVLDFLGDFLAPYQKRWKVDYASFRPQEEQGRKARVRARNDLLHTDAFPTRPTNGDRILRFFNNINPTAVRKWMTTETFDVLAPKFAGNARIPLPKPAPRTAIERFLANTRSTLRNFGIPKLARSPYDDFMLRFHHFLKENAEFQATCPKWYFDFAPGTSWMCYTDTVSHAVLSGQFALEQTLIVSRDAMVLPEVSPVGVLEKLVGARLTA
jgi:3-deoxy-D-manno-octulosonic acid hydroxylase-like protein